MMKKLTGIILGGLMIGNGMLALNPSPKPVAKVKMDMVQLKRDFQVFENIINTSVTQVLPHPMLLQSRARGAFLEGYGAVFSLSFNLNRSTVFLPMLKKSKESGDSRTTNQQTREKIRNVLVGTLIQYGDGIKQMPKNSRIVIAAHFINQTEYYQAGENSVIQLSIYQPDLEQYRRGGISQEELRKKVVNLEY